MSTVRMLEDEIAARCWYQDELTKAVDAINQAIMIRGNMRDNTVFTESYPIIEPLKQFLKDHAEHASR